MWPAARLAAILGLASQVVIVLATVLSYLAGTETYFNHPMALNQPGVEAVPMGQALVIRLGGLVVNTLANGIVGMIGWALGGLLPPPPSPARNS
jgi:cytochrome c-type biogenesis protein CcmE